MCLGTTAQAQPQVQAAQAAAPQPVQQPAQPTGSLIPASQDTRTQQQAATLTGPTGQATLSFVPLRQRQEERQQTLLGSRVSPRQQEFDRRRQATSFLGQ